jgi:Flp pilus assembly protein TadB
VTFLLIAFGVLLVAASGRLVAHAVMVPRIHLKQHLLNIHEYGFESGQTESEDAAPGPKQTIAALADRLGRFTLARCSWLPPVSVGDLAAAGFYDVTVERIHGYRVLAAALLGSVVGLLGLSLSGGPLVSLLFLAGGAGFGWAVPSVLIKGRGTRRLASIDKDLPELIDLLIATVEAGLSFGASLNLVGERIQGPLGDELRLAISQQNLGISTSQALEELLERCDSMSMRTFVRTVVRGESLGLSIAPILRELAIDMRRRRRQAAQERMHKAPIKILFPIMFLVMPALMIVLFYPAAHAVMTTLSNVA